MLARTSRDSSRLYYIRDCLIYEQGHTSSVTAARACLTPGFCCGRFLRASTVPACCATDTSNFQLHPALADGHPSQKSEKSPEIGQEISVDRPQLEPSLPAANCPSASNSTPLLSWRGCLTARVNPCAHLAVKISSVASRGMWHLGHFPNLMPWQLY